MSNGHTPSVESTRSLIVEMTETVTRDDEAARENGEQFDRLIEAVKAETLKEAAEAFRSIHFDDAQNETVKKFLMRRADRIKGEQS